MIDASGKAPAKDYSGVGFRLLRPYGSKNVVKLLQNVYINHISGNNLTNNHSISYKISGIDSDNITIKFIPQILTEKMGG